MGVFRKKENYYIDYYVNGYRKREKIGNNKRFAEMVLQKRVVQIAEDRFLDVKKDRYTKTEEIIRDFLEYSKNNKRSYARDISICKHLTAFFAGKRLKEITPMLIEQYKGKRLQGGRRPATVNREVACLKCMFNWAIKNKKATDNPVRQVKMLKENNARTRYLAPQEMIELLRVCPRALKRVVKMAILTGMRRNEILNLKWTNVNTPSQIITVQDNKTGYEKYIPIFAALAVLLSECFAESDGIFVCCNEYGQQYRRIDTLFQTVVKRAGIQDFHFHDLRHTAATYMRKNGADLLHIKNILGHRSLRMTERYAHIIPDQKLATMADFGSSMDTIWTPAQNKVIVKDPANMLFIDDKTPSRRGTQAAEGAGLLNL